MTQQQSTVHIFKGICILAEKLTDQTDGMLKESKAIRKAEQGHSDGHTVLCVPVEVVFEMRLEGIETRQLKKDLRKGVGKGSQGGCYREHSMIKLRKSLGKEALCYL